MDQFFESHKNLNSNASGIKQISGIVHVSYDALLVPPASAIAIAAALERLHRDREPLAQLILNGDKTAKQFTLESAWGIGAAVNLLSKPV